MDTYEVVKNKISLFFDLVLPWQSFSSLFWLFSGVLLTAQGNVKGFDGFFLLILVALLSARFAGMCLNRLCDRVFDAKNPRTQSRILPSGRVSVREVLLYTCVLCVLFSCVCYLLPPVGRVFGMCVGFLLFFYSYTKRFTYLCHCVLGLLHGMIPLVGSLWTTHTCTLSSIFLGAGAFCSISGTDIIYSLLDEEFDRKNNLKSIPARFGRKRAITCSFVLHMLSLALILTSFFLACALGACFVWAILSGFLCVLWFFFLKNTYDISSYFSHFLLFFSGGSFFSLGVNYLWSALL